MPNKHKCCEGASAQRPVFHIVLDKHVATGVWSWGTSIHGAYVARGWVSITCGEGTTEDPRRTLESRPCSNSTTHTPCPQYMSSFLQVRTPEELQTRTTSRQARSFRECLIWPAATNSPEMYALKIDIDPNLASTAISTVTLSSSPKIGD